MSKFPTHPPPVPGGPVTPPKPAPASPACPRTGPEASLAAGRVSARDIARRLRISHSTVSRALHDDPRISAAVRDRVQALARTLGYQPDPMLAALAHYRRHRGTRPVQAELAWINGWSAPRRLRSFREFDLYWRGAEDEAARAGFRLTEFCLDRDMSAARLGAIFQARNIRGLLIPPHGGARLDWTGFPWEAFSIVRFGHSLPGLHTHLVTSNQLHNGLLAFQRAWDRGYRRIGLVISDHATTRFAAGYLFAQMKAAPDAAPVPPFQLELRDEAATLRQLEDWLQAQRPDAILTDRRELRPLLARLGRRVPADLGVAAFSVLDGEVDAGIDQNSAEIGRAALQLLVSLIMHQERGLPAVCRELLIEGSWVDGASLPAR